MSNVGFKGLDVRQTPNELVFRAFLQSSAGAIVTSGTTVISLAEIQSDGTLKWYDFNDNTFKTGTLTTATLAMTEQAAPSTISTGATDSGFWTVALATLTGFTAGGMYVVFCNNSGASPTDQCREFQFGSAEGDMVVAADGGIGANLISILGTALTETSGYLAAAFKKFFNVASPVFTTASVNQTGDSYSIVNDGTNGNAAIKTTATAAASAASAAAQPGDKMDLIDAPNATAIAAFKDAVNNLAPGSSGATGSIRNQLAAIIAGQSGSIVFNGANSVTITVTDDSSNPLANALVRITLADLSQLQQTNGSGVAQTSAGVLPALDDGTYTLAVTCGFAYEGQTVSFSVDATHTTSTVVLPTRTIPTPGAGQCTGTLITVDSYGAPLDGVSVTFQAVAPTTGSGGVYDGCSVTAVSSSGGVIAREFPSGSIPYRYKAGNGPWVAFRTAASDGDTFNIASNVSS